MAMCFINILGLHNKMYLINYAGNIKCRKKSYKMQDLRFLPATLNSRGRWRITTCIKGL